MQKQNIILGFAAQNYMDVLQAEVFTFKNKKNGNVKKTINKNARLNM